MCIRDRFWVAVIPGVLAVILLLIGVQEPERHTEARRSNPISRENLRRLSPAYWWVVGIGAVFTLARFSEAFLVLRAEQGGISLAYVPLVMVAMNLIYAASAYPFGKLADRMSHTRLLSYGLLMLLVADLVLASSNHWSVVLLGVGLWGVHMGMTQGLLATMVADAASADLRGTAFGFFNLMSGIAMLLASITAGLFWGQIGAASYTYAGGAGCALERLRRPAGHAGQQPAHSDRVLSHQECGGARPPHRRGRDPGHDAAQSGVPSGREGAQKLRLLGRAPGPPLRDLLLFPSPRPHGRPLHTSDAATAPTK